jgi:hypothetical protein
MDWTLQPSPPAMRRKPRRAHKDTQWEGMARFVEPTVCAFRGHNFYAATAAAAGDRSTGAGSACWRARLRRPTWLRKPMTPFCAAADGLLRRGSFLEAGQRGVAGHPCRPCARRRRVGPVPGSAAARPVARHGAAPPGAPGRSSGTEPAARSAAVPAPRSDGGATRSQRSSPGRSSVADAAPRTRSLHPSTPVPAARPIIMPRSPPAVREHRVKRSRPAPRKPTPTCTDKVFGKGTVITRIVWAGRSPVRQGRDR